MITGKQPRCSCFNDPKFATCSHVCWSKGCFLGMVWLHLHPLRWWPWRRRWAQWVPYCRHSGAIQSLRRQIYSNGSIYSNAVYSICIIKVCWWPYISWFFTLPPWPWFTFLEHPSCYSCYDIPGLLWRMFSSQNPFIWDLINIHVIKTVINHPFGNVFFCTLWTYGNGDDWGMVALF